MDCELEPAPAPPPPVAAAVSALDRVAAGFEVLLCSGFPTQLIVILFLGAAGMQPRTASGGLSAPFIFTLTLIDTLLVVGLVVFFLQARRESVAEQLFGRRPPGREVLLGLALIPASFVVVVFVLLVVQLAAPGLRNVPHNPFADFARTGTGTAMFAFVVMVAGGVREEIQRGFVLRRFEQYLGGGGVGLIVFSALFGLGHVEQGRDVAIATAVLGAFWGAIFLARRSILGPMIGHAGFNLSQIAKFVVMGA